MPSPDFSSESGLESDALHINSSCASSGGGPPSGGRILYSLPGGLAHHYHALQASMSSGDNFMQGRNLSGLLPLVSRGHDGMPSSRVWTSFQVLQSGSSMGQQSAVSLQGSHDMSVAARLSDKVEANPGVVEEHGSNNEHGGASFAEHDYMSDVSSAPADEKCSERTEGKGDDAQDTDSNLNLRETELRLGPPESSSGGEAKNALLSGAKRGFSEAMGSLSESKRSLSEAAASVGESKRGFAECGINGHSPGEQAGAKPAEHRPRSNVSYTDARVSMILPGGGGNPPGSFTDVRSSYLDSRAGLFEHQGGYCQPKALGDGDVKGASQQQQGKQLGAGSAPCGFRVPSLPPPWQALDQSAASLGPFPSPKVLDCGKASDDASSCRNAPVVGWPPVRAFRKSTLSPPTPPLKATTESPGAVAAAAASSPAAAPATATAAAAAGVPTPQPRPVAEGMTKVMRPSAAGTVGAENGCRGNGGAGPSPNSVTSNYWFVKVYMDGVPFGRKVDLRIHGCYEKLSVGLEEMFTRYANVEQGSNGESKPLKFLQGSDYVLTYEDQDGDLMLVGDVPWNMFITSVKRLRIMKSSEAVGIAPRNSPKLWKGGAT